jgi:hypothetical protein
MINLTRVGGQIMLAEGLHVTTRGLSGRGPRPPLNPLGLIGRH